MNGAAVIGLVLLLVALPVLVGFWLQHQGANDHGGTRS